MAESLWEPDLPAEDLFETISQTLLNAVDRDAYSGWGAVVWIIEKVRRPSCLSNGIFHKCVVMFGCVLTPLRSVWCCTGQGDETMAQSSHGLETARRPFCFLRSPCLFLPRYALLRGTVALKSMKAPCTVSRSTRCSRNDPSLSNIVRSSDVGEQSVGVVVKRLKGMASCG